MDSLPRIQNKDGIATLYVHDEPFLALAGELHNSSSSSLEYMNEKVWPALKDLHLNCILVAIFWETIEPKEGVYDFTLLDGLIAQARENNVKLIILWFGLWKNAESMYVPSWMKQDIETYFRIERSNGDKTNTISPLCEVAVQKDAQAFTAVMKHLRETDSMESTVIVIQVENEVGILGSDRDYSAQANQAFREHIPEDLVEALGKRGNWKEAFGNEAEESFMTYYFARAIESIAKAGIAEYPLPCYTNAWLKQYPWYLGSYPSGGPVLEMHKIWKIVAPSLFTLAPDIYVPYVAEVLDSYSYKDNPLFVPEVRKDAVAASYCLYAFAKHNAICFSPFGIEELALDPSMIRKPPPELMATLNIDPSAFDIRGSKEYLARVYSLIDQMKPLYLKYRGTRQLQSYVKHSETDYGILLEFTEYDLAVNYKSREAAKPLAAGMVYEIDTNKFILIGMNSTLKFRPKNGENVTVDYLRLEDGEIINGEWKAGRILNGDEKMILQFSDLCSCLYVELYKY